MHGESFLDQIWIIEELPAFHSDAAVFHLAERDTTVVDVGS
jgi:hypothetical protein